MVLLATQTIASRFGTYHAGDAIDVDAVPPDTLAAWEAASLVASNEPAKEPPAKEPAAPPEQPQRRFVQDVEKAVIPQRRFEQATHGPKRST